MGALIVNVPTACVFVCMAMSVVSAFMVIDAASVMVTIRGVINPVTDPVADMLPAVMLPVVDIGLEPKAAKLAATSALP